MVPRFLLQPIVENALRHGLAVLPEGGRLRITATREPQCLRLIVWNDGAPPPATPREGVGSRDDAGATRRTLRCRGLADAPRGSEAGGVETVIELPA
ncbi:MAG: hypothetical protein IPP98_09750 [Gemmatimonadetes bacterium]|nr:hypothetical protein [Gemmatimonadota bacterium]